MPAYITGSVHENLPRRIERLLEENRILRNPPQKSPTSLPATTACGWFRSEILLRGDIGLSANGPTRVRFELTTLSACDSYN